MTIQSPCYWLLARTKFDIKVWYLFGEKETSNSHEIKLFNFAISSPWISYQKDCYLDWLNIPLVFYMSLWFPLVCSLEGKRLKCQNQNKRFQIKWITNDSIHFRKCYELAHHITDVWLKEFPLVIPLAKWQISSGAEQFSIT